MSPGGAESSGIDRNSADVLGKTDALEALNQIGNEGGCDDKRDDRCYDCSSIFPTPRIGQCYLGDIQDLLGELGNTGQSRSLCMTPTGHQYGNGDFDTEVNDDLVDIQDMLSSVKTTNLLTTCMQWTRTSIMMYRILKLIPLLVGLQWISAGSSAASASSSLLRSQRIAAFQTARWLFIQASAKCFGNIRNHGRGGTDSLKRM
eukprot:SAG11_NODE_8954_length_959_cov_1.166279_1_plen_202_part_01